MGKGGQQEAQPNQNLHKGEEVQQQQVQPLDLRTCTQAELYTFFYGTRAEREVLFGENVRDPTDEEWITWADEKPPKKNWHYTVL